MAKGLVFALQADRAGLRGCGDAVSCQGFLDGLIPPDSRELDKVDGDRDSPIRRPRNMESTTGRLTITAAIWSYGSRIAGDTGQIACVMVAAEGFEPATSRV